jgi:hypothetical protein
VSQTSLAALRVDDVVRRIWAECQSCHIL